MYTVLISLAVGVLAGVIWTLLGLWKTWAFGIVLGLTVFVICFILVSRRFGRKIQPIFEQAQKQIQAGKMQLALKTLEDLLAMSRWQIMLKGQVNAQIGCLAFTTGDEGKALDFLSRSSPRVADARLFLLLRTRGRRQEADKTLADACSAAGDNKWVANILACLAGRITSKQLAAAAKSEDPPSKEHLCEAYYYAGETCLLSGDRTAARRWFEKCIETGLVFDPDTARATPMTEYELAQWRLETLFADTVTSPPEKN